MSEVILAMRFVAPGAMMSRLFVPTLNMMVWQFLIKMTSPELPRPLL